MSDPLWADDALLLVTFDRGNATGKLITLSQIQFTLEEQVDSMLRIMMGSFTLENPGTLELLLFSHRKYCFRHLSSMHKKSLYPSDTLKYTLWTKTLKKPSQNVWIISPVYTISRYLPTENRKYRDRQWANILRSCMRNRNTWVEYLSFFSKPDRKCQSLFTQERMAKIKSWSMQWWN